MKINCYMSLRCGSKDASREDISKSLELENMKMMREKNKEVKNGD